ncbi:MAG TPA: tRNA glutamyl-Q(34) synthetase GluQRS [Burkholderiaceae bacterium]|jgi:glutamyl-Q tRNA(Asp) synthetase|nr:tRNA glutamyl-Q(34) synthetase GluQRS [Burkholderiaceae bacterium]
MTPVRYCGRFAPSPTGPLHLGSLVAALASWLDARAHRGRWLVRIEDIDPAREEPEAARAQLACLAALGLAPDQLPVFQSANSARYSRALAALQASGQVYRCTCSRAAVEQQAARLGLPPNVYAGTCRDGTEAGGPASLRVRVPAEPVAFVDRACGPFSQRLEREVGDFVLRRADGLWAYQLAVVVDDGAQQISHVVRGADLLDNTPRQIHLQRLLQLPTPRYLHVPVVLNATGEKLSKQTGAAPLNLSDRVGQLEQAWMHLGFAATGAATVSEFLSHAVQAWAARWCRAPDRADTIDAAGTARFSQPGADSTRPG